MERSWYVVRTYSGYEGRVKASLEERVKTLSLSDRVGRVLVPTEEVINIKEGKKRISTRKYFPGYVLIELQLDAELQHLIQNTPKVTGFLGSGDIPEALSSSEAAVLLKQVDEGLIPHLAEAKFDEGDKVRIVDGPFMGFNGVVNSVDIDHDKVQVLVTIFGRSTPVELSFLQVEKG